MTTTDLHGIGSYCGSATLENFVEGYLGEHADDYDVDGLVAEFRYQLNERLAPTGITLAGDNFYSTVPVAENHAELIKDALDTVDLAPIAERFDVNAPTSTMTSTEVAQFLGLARGSLANVLRRKGVRPIEGRRSGDGQNIYDAQTIHLFKRGVYRTGLAEVPEETEIDTTAFVPGWTHVEHQVEVRETHPALPPMLDRASRLMRPNMVTANYRYDQPGTEWKVSVRLNGLRIRLNGTEGGAWVDEFYTLDEVRNRGPVWLIDWVRTHTPPVPKW